MSSSRSASSVPTTVFFDVVRARRHQEDADRVARARGEDVVGGVADDVEPVGVGAARLAPSARSSECQRSPRTSVATA